MRNAMIIDGKDNVIVAIEAISKGDTVTYLCDGAEKTLPALEDITIYHKLAARDIKMGEHVHCHNLEEHRENLDNKG